LLLLNNKAAVNRPRHIRPANKTGRLVIRFMIFPQFVWDQGEGWWAR
jgi:hypothetical protein